MDPSRYFKNQFEDFKPPFAGQLPDELVQIRNALESKNFFLPYLNQVNAAYPYNDVYVGKYGVLLLYYFLDKKFPAKFRQQLLDFYSSCIGKVFFSIFSTTDFVLWTAFMLLEPLDGSCESQVVIARIVLNFF